MGYLCAGVHSPEKGEKSIRIVSCRGRDDVKEGKEEGGLHSLHPLHLVKAEYALFAPSPPLAWERVVM